MRSTGNRFMTLLCFLIPMALYAVEMEDAEGKKLSISGTIEIETAELVKARTSKNGGGGGGETVNHIWYGHTIGTLNLSSAPTAYFTVRAGFEFRQYLTMLPRIADQTFSPRDWSFGNSAWNGFFVREFQGIFSILKQERNGLGLDVAFGYMPYKYNPEVRDMGEFLFRSGTYPLFLLNEFDRPFARLTGLRASVKHKGDMLDAHLDVLALWEREIRPFNDLSLGAIAGIDILKILSLGGGIELAHLLPMDSRLASMETNENRYLVYNADSTQVDTGYYTFSGTKLMARATIDPFGMFREEEGTIKEFIGKSGGKIYGEYAIIGLKNYPVSAGQDNPRGYLSVKERSPWMVGVHIPLWLALDECVLEFERWPGYYPDNYYKTVISGTPLPATRTTGTAYDTAQYMPQWRWSLYMKKRITENIAIVGQIGRNHQRWEYHPAEGMFYDMEAAFVRHDEWGWHLMAVFSF
jgi:hypothetical protein